jgi:hypothetical protein
MVDLLPATQNLLESWLALAEDYIAGRVGFAVFSRTSESTRNALHPRVADAVVNNKIARTYARVAEAAREDLLTLGLDPEIYDAELTKRIEDSFLVNKLLHDITAHCHSAHVAIRYEAVEAGILTKALSDDLGKRIDERVAEQKEFYDRIENLFVTAHKYCVGRVKLTELCETLTALTVEVVNHSLCEKPIDVNLHGIVEMAAAAAAVTQKSFAADIPAANDNFEMDRLLLLGSLKDDFMESFGAAMDLVTQFAIDHSIRHPWHMTMLNENVMTHLKERQDQLRHG